MAISLVEFCFHTHVCVSFLFLCLFIQSQGEEWWKHCIHLVMTLTPSLTQFFHLHIKIERTLILLVLIHVAFLFTLPQKYYLTIAFILFSQRVNKEETQPLHLAKRQTSLLTTIFSPSALFMGGVLCPNSFRCEQPILVREDYVQILNLIQSLLQRMGVLLWRALEKVCITPLSTHVLFNISSFRMRSPEKLLLLPQ